MSLVTENQGFGGATKQDMSLNETCLYSRLYGMWSAHPQCLQDPTKKGQQALHVYSIANFVASYY